MEHPKWFEPIFSQIAETYSAPNETIGALSLSGKVADFPDTRITSLGHFSIVYKVSAKQIIVTGFWDNRQDSEQLLRDLEVGE